MTKTISYGKSVYSSKEIKAVTDCLKHSTQMGVNVKNFEKKISKLFNKKKTVMVNSGSSALLLAFESLNFKKGSNFITPVMTFGTTISSMVRSGYIPNFIDVNVRTLCIDEEQIEKKINKKTVGICAPNLIGNMPNWKIIKKIAKKYKLFIIEDSADTLGSKLDNKSSGYYSDISITSYYGSHIINCAGNGGSLSMNNSKLFEKSLLLRSWGRSSSLFLENSEKIENRFKIKIDGIDYDKKFVFEELGFNLEPSEIGAAFGLVQLKNLNKNIKIRDKNFNSHMTYVSKRSKFFIPPLVYDNVKTSWLAFPLILSPFAAKKIKRNDLMIHLEKNNVQTRVVFTGNILRQPGFKKIKCIKQKKYNNSDYLMKNSILIGLHHGLKSSDIKKIHKYIDSFLHKLKLI